MRIVKRKASLLNIALIGIICCIIIGRLYWFDNRQEFRIEYGNVPTKFIEYLQNSQKVQFNNISSLIVIFNKPSTFRDQILLEKVEASFQKDLDIIVVNNSESQGQVSIFYRDGNYDNAPQGYYILLNKRKVKEVKLFRNLRSINWGINKILYPELTYKDYAISVPELKKRVVNKLNETDLRFYDVKKDGFIQIKSLKSYRSLYLGVAGCVECKLRNLKQLLDKADLYSKKQGILIFPADIFRHDIATIIYSLKIPVLIDFYDHFDLLSTITSKKAGIIRIVNREEGVDL